MSSLEAGLGYLLDYLVSLPRRGSAEEEGDLIFWGGRDKRTTVCARPAFTPDPVRGGLTLSRPRPICSRVPQSMALSTCPRSSGTPSIVSRRRPSRSPSGGHSVCPDTDTPFVFIPRCRPCLSNTLLSDLPWLTLLASPHTRRAPPRAPRRTAPSRADVNLCVPASFLCGHTTYPMSLQYSSGRGGAGNIRRASKEDLTHTPSTPTSATYSSDDVSITRGREPPAIRPESVSRPFSVFLGHLLTRHV